MTSPKSIEELKDECRKVIERANTVLQELPQSAAWNVITEDFGRQKKMIDDNWHLVHEEDKLDQLRTTKLAVLALVSIVESYKHDLNQASKQLNELENPDTVTAKDYDGE